MVSRVIPVETFDLVIFGGTGDLARRKILPGLFRRFLAGQMPAGSRIIGAARAVEICRSLTAQFGPRFHAPALLREMAEKGETFYGRFGGEKQAA